MIHNANSIIKNVKKLVLIILFVFTAASIAKATTYYSSANNAANLLTSWWTNTNGTGSHPANFTTAGDIFIIQPFDNMTTSGDWTVAGTVQVNLLGSLINTRKIAAGSLIINSLGSVTNNSSGTITASSILINSWGELTNNNNITVTGTLQVVGTFTNNNSGITAANAIQIDNGGLLTNNNSVSASTAIINSGGDIDNYKDLTVTSGTALIQIAGTLTNNSTGNVTAGTIQIDNGGNLDNSYTLVASTSIQINNGGTLTNNNNNANVTTGALNVSGAIDNQKNTVITVNGKLTVSGTGVIDLGSSNGQSYLGTLNLLGDFSFSTGGRIRVGGNNSRGGIIFKGAGTQTFTSGGTFSNVINFTVNSGSTLQMGSGANPAIISGSTGSFTLSTGATLGVTSPNGITTSGASGNIQVAGTRTYSAGANYIYNGSANQDVGNGLTVNCPADVEINNPGKIVSLGTTTTISGSLVMTSGTLNLKGYSTTVGDIQGSGNVTSLVAGAVTLTAGSNNTSTSYSGIISNGSGTVSLVKNGSGTLTLGNANIYTGATTINGGILLCGATDAPGTNSSLILNGGTLSSGTSIGFNTSLGTGTVKLTQNTTIHLGTGAHSLRFAKSSGVSWTSGAYLTVTGWVGTYNGISSGSEGKIYIGSDATGLTSSQVNQIQFLNSADSRYYPAVLLGTGEIVPGATPLVLSNLVYPSPNFFVRGTAISFLTPTVNNNGAVLPLQYSVSPGLPTGLSLNTTTGVISGTPTVSQNWVTYTITVNDQASHSTSFAIQILVHTPQNFYARTSGDWNVPATWSHVSGSSSSAIASDVPLPGDAVIIGDAAANGNRTVTVQGGYNAVCQNISIGTNGNTSNNFGLTMLDAAATLNIGGDITINRSTRNNGPTNSLTISGGNINVGGNVTLPTGTNTSNTTIIIDNGSLTISGNLTFPSGTSTNSSIDLSGGNGTINLAGTFTVGAGTFSAGTSSTFNYNGSGNQTIPALTYANLSCTGGGTKSFAGPTIMNGNFSISNGVSASGGAYALTLLGNWVNEGTFTPGTSTVTFAGMTQSISGTQVQTFNNLTISPIGGGVVTILPSTRVTVTGALTNTSGTGSSLVIESDATNSGSLIVSGTSSGNLTYKRYMSGNQWHVVSAPVSGQGINSLLTDAANSIPTSGSTYGMGYYNEGADSWTFYTTATAPSSGNLNNGQGYLLRTTSDRMVSFIGAVNGDVNGISITYGNYGWNAVGNPYTSAINATATAQAPNNFLTINTSSLDPSYAALYFWDPATSTYKTINNAGTGTLGENYIQAGQGFVIRSKKVGGTVRFTQAMQTHQGSISFKSAPLSWPTVRLIAESGSKSSNTLISFNENMTTGLDVTYDAGLFKNNPNFALYSRLIEDNGVDFAIQCLPEKYDSLVIPIGMDAPVGTTITFRAEATDFPADCKFYLEDRSNNKLIGLDSAKSAYTVAITSKNKGVGAFFLRTFKSAGNTNNSTPVETVQSEEFIKVIANSRDASVRILSMENLPLQVKVYDVTGKIITVKDLVGGNDNIVYLQNNPGVYIIQVMNRKHAISQKVILY